jgi:hypothetical protein
MNHQFQSGNPIDPLKCIDCGFPENKHGPNAPCDSCNNTGTLEFYLLGNSQALLCRDCIEREKQHELADAIRIQEDYQNPEKQQARLDAYNSIVRPYEQMIRNARKIDEQVHLSTDIFNAKTVAFQDIWTAVWKDDSIESDKKYFELARIAKQRILHFQNIIFELDKQKIEAYSEQKSWHVALNDLANKLRVEEREALRISDITYDVKMPKVVTPRSIKIAPKKASKEEIRALSTELGMPEFTIQLVMTSKNWTFEQVGNHFRKSIKEGLSMNTPTNQTNANGEMK